MVVDPTASLLTQVAHATSLAMMIAGCLLLHARLHNRASLSLLMALGAIALWMAWGQSALSAAIIPPTSPTAGTAGDNAQDAINALVDLAQAERMLAVFDAMLVTWLGASFVFSAWSIHRQRGIASAVRPTD